MDKLRQLEEMEAEALLRHGKVGVAMHPDDALDFRAKGYVPRQGVVVYEEEACNKGTVIVFKREEIEDVIGEWDRERRNLRIKLESAYDGPKIVEGPNWFRGFRPFGI